MMMSHSNLQSYYKINFAMAQHHKYSIAEIEDMIPFERDLYVDLLIQYVKSEQERASRSG